VPSAEVAVLRLLRESVLRKGTLGQWLIGGYYRSAPAIFTMLARHAWLQSLVRLRIRTVAWVAESTLYATKGGSINASGWSLLGLAAIVLLFVLHWVGRERHAAIEGPWMPRDLQDAELAYAEQRFLAKAPVALVARVDRAYRLQNGVMTLVELKTRHVNRVYLDDVIELSAQRYALEAHTRATVALQAYVLVQQTGAPTEDATPGESAGT